ncbi:MAG: site-specific integrase [Proteobacteria bacterium]|nr:MAG: site-specific integrase [Pseudomonadota bacterium]|tara:strand:+ start:808 stop:1959 length:1152 start_codon:yes stop_codon:yes gene_type:complete
MPKQLRNTTRHSGVYFVLLDNGDQTFFIRYRKGRILIEEKAGRKSQGWTAAKANRLRTERLAGKSESNNVKRSNERAEKESFAERWTFQKLFDEYLASRPDLKGRANDVRRFKTYLEKKFAGKTPEEVTLFDINELKKELGKKKLKPATIRHALEVLNRISNFAAKNGLCPGISFVVEMPKVNNIKTEDLSPEELNRLLKVLNNEHDLQAANLVRLALFTGMRRGELFNLKWDDINSRRKTITIKDPKGGVDQIIPLNGIAEKVLKNHPETGSEFVFPAQNGGRLKKSPPSLNRIKANAQLPEDFRILHGLRHVYASTLASSGKVDLYTLQKLLTHKTPSMTQRYAHLRNEALMDASNVISEITKSETEIIQLAEHKKTKGEL